MHLKMPPKKPTSARARAYEAAQKRKKPPVDWTPVIHHLIRRLSTDLYLQLLAFMANDGTNGVDHYLLSEHRTSRHWEHIYTIRFGPEGLPKFADDEEHNWYRAYIKEVRYYALYSHDKDIILRHALSRRHLNIIKRSVDRDEVDQKFLNDGLKMAIVHKDPDLTKYFLEAGAEAIDALTTACRMRDINLLKLLFDHANKRIEMNIDRSDIDWNREARFLLEAARKVTHYEIGVLDDTQYLMELRSVVKELEDFLSTHIFYRYNSVNPVRQ